MLLDDKKKKKTKGAGKARGALKKSAADVKIGPLRHCLGSHADGAPLHVAVQVRVACFLLYYCWCDVDLPPNPCIDRRTLRCRWEWVEHGITVQVSQKKGFKAHSIQLPLTCEPAAGVCKPWNEPRASPYTQAVVKEGVTTPTLVVKLTLERPCTHN